MRLFGKLTSVLLLTVLLLVVIDQLTGIIIPLITTEPPMILHGINAGGIADLWKMESADLSPVVFTGSSQMEMGVSPHLFDNRVNSLTGRSIISVNTGVTSSVVVTSRDMIRDVIAPSGAKTIIYGVEMWALRSSDAANIAINDFYTTPLGGVVADPLNIRRSTMVWLMQHSALYRYRENIRHWMDGNEPTSEQVAYLQLKLTIDDRGYLSSDLPHIDRNTISTYFVPFQTNEIMKRAFLDIAATCQDESIRCIIVNMPLNPDAYLYISQADETLYLNTLHELVATGKLPLWDFDTAPCRALLGKESFWDMNHLNRQGAQTFSRMVADRYVHDTLEQAAPSATMANCSQDALPSTLLTQSVPPTPVLPDR